jgi:hypothetical protein
MRTNNNIIKNTGRNRKRRRIMKTKTYVIMTGVLLLAACSAQAVLDEKIFTSSGQILPGEEWNDVFIYNDDTIVDMLGGFVEGLGTYDASTINVTAGAINGLSAHEFSSANVSGGTHGTLEAWDSATVKVFPGATLFRLNASGSGTAYMTGGITEYVGAGDSSVMNLYGGVITDCLAAGGSSTINIYGYDFDYDPTGGGYDGGQLTGFWLNGSPFMLDLYGAETYSHINQVPEPSGLVILALGALLAKRAC